jgi:hypothetical protein
MEPGGGFRYSSTIPKRLIHKDIIVNIAKNMEAIFILALALAGTTSFATAAGPAFKADAAKVQLVKAGAVQVAAAAGATRAQ